MAENLNILLSPQIPSSRLAACSIISNFLLMAALSRQSVQLPWVGKGQEGQRPRLASADGSGAKFRAEPVALRTTLDTTCTYIRICRQRGVDYLYAALCLARLFHSLSSSPGPQYTLHSPLYSTPICTCISVSVLFRSKCSSSSPSSCHHSLFSHSACPCPAYML